MRVGIAQGPPGHGPPVACMAPNSIILFLLEATACVVDEFLASVVDMCEGYGVKAALETQLKVGTTVCHSTLQFSLSPKSNHVHFSLGLAVGLV